MRKIKRVIGYTLGIAMVLIAAIFLLNLHLTKRLERYLRKELIHRTAEATDGFYRLSFDNLSISFFKGELTLEGIKLCPDSAVFRDWERKDSLPSVYVTAEVGMIDCRIEPGYCVYGGLTAKGRSYFDDKAEAERSWRSEHRHDYRVAAFGAVTGGILGLFGGAFSSQIIAWVTTILPR